MSAPRHFLPEAMMAQAREQTAGLSDFGDPSFRAGLDTLCEALDTQARLSDTGRYVLQQKIVGQLANRLRIEDWFSRHPEVANEALPPPVVIVGLPRTGTTKLHRLLACDPAFHWMAFWESQFPVPFENESLEQPSERIAQAHAMVDMMTEAMPKLTAIHPMDADAADEEVMLTEHSFLSAFNAYADIPGYMSWLDRQDQTPVYEYLRRMLQFLQWQKRKRGIVAERWVLKAPHHLLRMDTLLRVFPGALVVQTHRDPLQSIPSIASFIHTLWCIYSDDADPAAAGRSWSELMNRALLHTMRVRQSAPAQFLDVRFEDTVRRPLAVARRIYAFIGRELKPEVETAMARWLASDAETHKAGHDYSAAQFGLSDEGLRADFAAYRDRHIEKRADTA